MSEAFIEDAFFELKYKAELDNNKCFGYFPTMSEAAGIDHDLPASRRLSEAMSVVETNATRFHFSFVRLSIVKQRGSSSFHLDTDASTALTGSIATIRNRLVWRLLLNLSSEYSRRVAFLAVDPDSVDLGVDGGYLYADGTGYPHVRYSSSRTALAAWSLVRFEQGLALWRGR